MAMRRNLFWGTFLALLLTAAGCDTATSPLDTVSRGKLMSKGLHLTVSTIRTGPDSLTFHHKLENRGPEDRTLKFFSSQDFDVEVRSQGGELLWQWSHDKYFMPVVLSVQLVAGESQTGEVVWDLKGNDGTPLPPGVYKCKFYLTCSPNTGLVSEFTLTL
jgi:hypothetical protein